MARSSSRSSVLVLASAVVVITTAATAAHRRDEYLQAARVALEPRGAQIQLDLTPGIAVAEDVLAAIDRDRSGAISDVEGDAYASALRSAISLDIDGTPLSVKVVDTHFPAVDAVRRGEGTIRVTLIAPIPALAAGPHHLRYRNRHRADIGVYLANALMPMNRSVTISGQRRDVAQRELVVDYELSEDPMTAARGWFLAGLVALTLGLAVVVRRHTSVLGA